MGFFPPDHKFAADSPTNSSSENNDKFYSPGKELGDGDSNHIIVCGGYDTGHVISGYKYFKHDGQPHTTPSNSKGKGKSEGKSKGHSKK